MKYKGYTGVVEFDEDSGSLFGHVIGLRDGITFQGDSVAEVIQAFHDSVDDYLEFCAERGESPEKPFSGQFVLRIDPQLHRVMSHAAEERGVSLNSLVEEELRAAFLRGASGGGTDLESILRHRAAAKRTAAEATIGPGKRATGKTIAVAGRRAAYTKRGPSSPDPQPPKSSKGPAAGKGGKS